MSASQWPLFSSQTVPRPQTVAHCSGDSTFNFGTTASHCLNLHNNKKTFKKVIIAQDVLSKGEKLV